jgi:ceramide glucosyltransferase
MTGGPETDLAAWVGGACSLAAAVGVAYLALASFLIMRFQAGRRRAPARCPSASILVPLCGEESELRERLLALCRQTYGGALQLVCGVSDAADPAVGVVKSVAAERPDVRIDLKIDPRQHGGNRKISNLINMTPLAQAEFLAIIDSDILVGPNHLSELASELDRPGVGAVTCLYHGVGGTGLWSSLAALSINADFLPNVIVALGLGAARPCFGATIALRRRTLEAIGGLRAFADCLHDDYAIGERLREAGYAISIPRFSVAHVCRERTARALIQNQVRAADHHSERLRGFDHRPPGRVRDSSDAVGRRPRSASAPPRPDGASGPLFLGRARLFAAATDLLAAAVLRPPLSCRVRGKFLRLRDFMARRALSSEVGRLARRRSAVRRAFHADLVPSGAVL